MRTVRMLAAAGIIAAGAVALPAPAQDMTAARLGATTTIVANHSGAVRVALYDDARLSYKSLANPDTSIRGAGRFVGAWLSREDAANSAQFSDRLAVYRTPKFDGAQIRTVGSVYPQGQCDSLPNNTVVLYSDCTHMPKPKYILLHQGYYWLNVITDGSPIRITLHLHGPSGHSTIRPTHAFRTAEAPLRQRDGIDDRLVTFSATQRGFSDHTMLLQFVSAKVAAADTTGGASACYRFEDANAEPPLAYGPTCPGGAGGGGYYYLHQGPVNEGGVWAAGTTSDMSRSGTLGQGGSVWSDQGVSFKQGLGVWISTSCNCWAV